MQVNDIAGDFPVHVIDCDSRRRADISRELIARQVHAEIYEDAAEFVRILPATGSVLMVEDAERCNMTVLLGQLQAKGRYYPVSMYSHAPQAALVVRAMREGAIDYLTWPFDPDLLGEALARLHEEGHRRRKVEQAKAAAKASVGQLTGREHDVLVSLLHGNSNKQIAAALELSPRTVEIYRKNVMRKLDAKSASEAVRIGIYADLWELPVG
jgi:FixJ family two-component response regulator